jgi:hypothetical protein
MMIKAVLPLLMVCLLSLLPACANEPRYVDIAFSVGADGTLLWTQFQRHAGQMTDEDALAAVVASAPFMPLPLGSADHAEFLLKFVYYCHGPAYFDLTRVGTTDVLSTDPEAHVGRRGRVRHF